MMIRTLMFFFVSFIISCDSGTSSPTKVIIDKAMQCTIDICEILVDKAPIIPNHKLKWDWNWTTKEACLSTMSCGQREDECRIAVSNLDQIGPGSTPEVNDSDIYHIWHACRDISGSAGPSPSKDK